MILNEGMTLYHGSYAPISVIDLSKCANGKDFGRGFYVTSDKDQAVRFIKTSLLKAQQIGVVDTGQKYGYLSEFCFHQPACSLRVHSFAAADGDWLRFIAINRRPSLAKKLQSLIDSTLNDADVVIGKVANDTTNTVITTYLNGLYGPVNGESSIRIAISQLLPERLKDQYCFLTEKSIACLEPLRVERYEV